MRKILLFARSRLKRIIKEGLLIRKYVSSGTGIILR